MKRPSPASIVALLALFVALGGPAQAAKLLIGSKQIKDGAIAGRDLRPGLVAQLRIPADGSVGPRKLAGGAVTGAKIAKGAVDGAAIADGSVGSADLAPGAAKLADKSVDTAQLADRAVTDDKLAGGAVTNGKLAPDAVGGGAVKDGSLTAKDIGSHAGTAPITLALVPAQPQCSAGTSTSLNGSGSLNNDAIVLTPPGTFPDTATVYAKPAGDDVIRVVACAPPGVAPPVGEVVFRYVAIDA